MDKKSKIFFLVFFLLIVGSVAVTYWRIMVKRDYIISAQTECDPAAENCFVYECDPEDPEDPECATLPEEERVSYYKIINKNAQNIPLCDATAGECPEDLACEEGEEECETILCDEENVPEGESCNDPAAYLEENPPEECGCGENDDEPVGEATESEEENIESDAKETGGQEKPACDCNAAETEEAVTEEE